MPIIATHLGRQVALGKAPPRHDARTLRLAKYLAPDLPPAPESVDWRSKASLPQMLGNDEVGDCAFASIGHIIQCWTAENGKESLVSTADIIGAYSAVTGYVPGDESTDNGTVMLDALNYWRKSGIGGHKIDAFVALDLKNREQFKRAIYMFGTAHLGFSLPKTIESMAQWRVLLGGPLDATPGSLGGHAVAAHAYDDEGITISTWDMFLHVSWPFVDAYADEGFALMSSDWADGDGAPSGFAYAELQQDLARVAG